MGPPADVTKSVAVDDVESAAPLVEVAGVVVRSSADVGVDSAVTVDS